jgi:hypothetical protein
MASREVAGPPIRPLERILRATGMSLKVARMPIGIGGRAPALRSAIAPLTSRRQPASSPPHGPSVTRQNDQAVMALLEPGYDPPAAVVAEFDRLRAIVHDGIRDWKGRWSPRNIADVSAYMLLSSYGVFHARPSVSERGSLQVRSTARNAMALNRRVRRLSDARKQTAAEMLELRTIFRLSDVNVARMEGDATRELAAKARLRSWVKEAFGVDLERVRLTRKGLVPQH